MKHFPPAAVQAVPGFDDDEHAASKSAPKAIKESAR